LWGASAGIPHKVSFYHVTYLASRLEYFLFELVIAMAVARHVHACRPLNTTYTCISVSGECSSIEVKNNESVFTSGDYERFYTYHKQRFHHIIDPRTGYPTHDAQSVTVLHSDAGRADAAATALFVAGSKDWQRIAKKMGISHVMLIDSKGDVHLTPAMAKRIKFLNKSPASHIIVSEEL